MRDRAHFPDELVDLIYLDPPFNSKRDYNLLFNTPEGQANEAQVEAFKDTWQWDAQAEREFDELLHQPNTSVAGMMKAMRAFLGENDMMAYLTMMANRLLEMHRVLASTGSLYLHCDPTAAHYLKMVLDGVFGQEFFRSEIIWRRTNAHNKLTHQFGPIHDTIFFYTKSDEFTFHPGTTPYSRTYIESRFVNEDKYGRYQTNYLTGPGKRSGESGVEWGGFNPTMAGRHWAIPASLRQFLPDNGKGMKTVQMLDSLRKQDFIVFPKKAGGQPMYKQYIGPGVLYQDIWSYQPNTNGVLFGSNACIDEDVKYLESEEEMLGYPTQKPLGVLERIITTSSDEGDMVLDPFCGCGTAVHAAQKLKRKWIGIDITHFAISLIEKRLKDAFGVRCKFEVHGTPKDLESACDLAKRDKYQFQWWAVSLVDAQPWQGKKKGADTGIDGIKFFRDLDKKEVRTILVSVKGGEHVGPAMVKDLIATIAREKAEVGLFVTLTEPTKAMTTEAVAAGFYESPNGKKFPRLQILTIEDLLSGQRRAEHPDYEPALNFKKAQAEANVEQKNLI